MNLPVSVEDLSLLQHAPLCNRVVVHETTEGRSATKLSLSEFVKEMQQNARAVAAAMKWAHLVFEDALSDGSSLEVTDGGEELYKVFLEYQCRLYCGTKNGDFDGAIQYKSRIVRKGIGVIKAVEINGHASKTKLSGQASGRENGSKGEGKRRASRSSGPKKTCRPVAVGIFHPDAEDHTECSSPGGGSYSATTSGPATQQEPVLDPYPAGGIPSSPEGTKPGNRSTSKKDKKRKASSQKSAVITPSDASEDDKGPTRTYAVAAARTTSHQSKRIASNPSRQAHDLFGVANQVDTTGAAHSAEVNQYRRGATSIPQRQSPLTCFTSNGFVSHPRIKGSHGGGFPHRGRKYDRARFSNVSTQPFRPGQDFGGPRKIKPVKKPLELRPNKRMRRASGSTPHWKAGEEPESVHDLRVGSLQGSSVKGHPVNDSPLTRENIKARKKRTRHEFETSFVASDKNVTVNSYKLLGPDVRLLRPLPRKVHTARLGSAVCGIPCGPSSLEHTDQLIRDAASNALAIMNEEVGPDIADWTEDKDHDAECDDLQGDDQDEVTSIQDTTTTSAPSKSPLPAPPRIWAQSRQEVCESFDYFRCYHGGVYSKDDIVKGYLLGAYSASRDVFHHGGKLIISHGGGKSESMVLDSRGRPKRLQPDQDQEASDKSVRALLKTCKDRRPIVLLADDKYALFPYDLTSANHTYVVLGLYWISHAWAECQSTRDGSGRIVRWKFAFQWCESQSHPWWLPQQDMTHTTPYLPNSIPICSTNDLSKPADLGTDPSTQCENCWEHSPFVYKQGWMCLNPRCDLFWSINSEEPKQLDYREEFLKLLPQKFDRLPNITPVKVVETTDGITTTYAFSKGLHCTNCGRLSCRYKWECWECSNCNFKHVVDGRLRSPKEFWHQRPSKGFLHSQIAKDSGILACRLEPVNLGARKGFTNRLTFVLPYARGRIHLILGTPLSNGDADNIFQLYQQQASTGELRLRRYPLRTHRARGPLLTNYFSQNSGEPYQYVGGSGQTVPFREAPDCVRRALALIKERAGLALGIDIPFNEILSAAYMERQKMSFHSDSEKGLGPIVASLSLGSAALMHFRPHVNVVNPAARNGCALTLALRHGDVLIMEGDGVQKYYEHTVVPMNFRIAATARCIGSA